MSNESEIYPNRSQDSVNSENAIFDFDNFFINIRRCISDTASVNDDIELESYLLAYEQLHKFFILLGGAFQFVAIDVKSKIKVLQEFRENEKKKSIKNFSTVKSMVNYEKQSKSLENPKYISGSRTLLRLHRGLDFIKNFLTEIYQSENNAKLGGIARDVYDSTLAEYHTWVVRNASRVAMKFLPTKMELLSKISQNDEEILSHMLEILPQALETLNIVYDRVQHIYKENEILDLP